MTKIHGRLLSTLSYLEKQLKRVFYFLVRERQQINCFGRSDGVVTFLVCYRKHTLLNSLGYKEQRINFLTISKLTFVNSEQITVKRVWISSLKLFKQTGILKIYFYKNFTNWNILFDFASANIEPSGYKLFA